MNTIFDFDSALSGRLCLTWLHSIWQIALLALCALIATRIWRRRNPEAEFVICVAALLIGLIAIQ